MFKRDTNVIVPVLVGIYIPQHYLFFLGDFFLLVSKELQGCQRLQTPLGFQYFLPKHINCIKPPSLIEEKG